MIWPAVTSSTLSVKVSSLRANFSFGNAGRAVLVSLASCKAQCRNSRSICPLVTKPAAVATLGNWSRARTRKSR